jgi:hypothetical protein
MSPQKIPHPDLIPLLEKHCITWEEYQSVCRVGRTPKALAPLNEKKKAIITDLHLQGTPWAKMMEITGLSNGNIQRNTKGMWNEASRINVKESAAKVGHARKGEKKPWLTELMKKEWVAGKFDFHIGRVRSEEEMQILKDSQTPELRAHMSKVRKDLWATAEYRDNLLDFHRSPEERAKRSASATEQSIKNPITYGIAAWYEPAKCSKHPIYTRSSYERATCDLFDSHPVSVIEGFVSGYFAVLSTVVKIINPSI